ncbi:MAG TPA: hypothetical protein VII68_17925 [Casimicrobiaceae bacterium]
MFQPLSSAVPATRSRLPRRVITIFHARSVSDTVGAPRCAPMSSVIE